MITGFRMVRLSERGERALFAGYARLEVAKNPAMGRIRQARYRKKGPGYRSPMQRRAYQCLNCMGKRIWANKPRLFNGYRWKARRATIAAFVK